jgi:hypothetical protein
VSRCPGVIEPNLHPACRVTTTFANFTSITAFNRGLPGSGLNTQDGLAGLGCLAPGGLRAVLRERAVDLRELSVRRGAVRLLAAVGRGSLLNAAGVPVSDGMDKFTVSRFVALLVAASLAHAAPGDPIDPTDGDGDGAPDEVEANEGYDPTFRDNDIFGNARLFVMQQYRDFLSRESDASGTDFWVAAMLPKASSSQAPVQRTALIQTFLESGEFGGVVAPVARLYFAYFLRIPDYGGLNYWIGRHRSATALSSISDHSRRAPSSRPGMDPSTTRSSSSGSMSTCSAGSPTRGASLSGSARSMRA